MALTLARQGHGLVIHYMHSQADALQTREDCLKAGAPNVELLQADLSQPTARAALLAQAEEVAGPVHLLINSASLFEYDDAATFTPERLDQHLQTNFLAPAELTLALYQRALTDPVPRHRHVVTLLDQKVVNLNTDYTSYTLAKLASAASIRFLAQSCAPQLRVNAVAPGVTLVSGDMDEAAFHQAHRVAALGASSTPQDIADAVLYLDRAGAITGQTLVVDGGQHLIPRGRDVAFELDPP